MSRGFRPMRLSEKEVRTVYVVLESLLSDERAEYILGSLTREEAGALREKIAHYDFCKRHGIKRWQDMDEADYENEYNEIFDTAYDDD